MATMVAVVCLVPTTYATTEAKTPFQECMDNVDLGAMKNSQWMACAAEDLEREDEKLNETYRNLIKLNPGKSKVESRNALIKAQRSWISFRDGWCSYVGTLPYAPSDEINRIWCLRDLTHDQNERLRPILSDFIHWKDD
jgi:uncharacterized protein YecT (DUF1311 family)